MSFCLRALALLSVFTCSLSHAAEFRLARAGAHHLVSYAANEVFVVEVFGRGTDGWPELKTRKHFSSQSKASEYLDRAFPDRALITSAQPESSARELRAGQEPLWEVKNAWDWEWEKKFAEWIRNDVNADFFVKHKIATDCADVAYAFRWIFARIHALPVTSRLTTGEWLSQNSVRPAWANLPSAPEWHKDQKFRAALNYLFDATYTHTLLPDAYPVEIRTDVIMEGGFQLDLSGPSGHTRPITRVLKKGEPGVPVQLLMSTVPRAIRKLMSDGYWISALPDKKKGGLLRFRWPKTSEPGLIAPREMPHYSDEQFDPSFLKDKEPFFLAVFKRLNPSVSMREIAFGILRSTKDYLVARQAVVRDGYEYCRNNPCEPNTPAWENWSTPTRDARVQEQLSQVQNVKYYLPKDLQEEFQKEFEAPFFEEGGLKLALPSLAWIWSSSIYSSDPRVSPDRRWGVTAAGFHEFLVENIRKNWEEREKIVREHSGCAPEKCVPDSAAWKLKSTQTQDSRLLRAFNSSRGYCENFPLSACAQLEAKLGEPFDLYPGLSLRDTLRKFLTLNSDPRHSAENRRHGFGDKFRLLPLRGVAYLTATSQTHLFDMGYQRHYLWNIEGEPVEIKAPANTNWLNAHLEINQAWFHAENTIGLADMKGAELARTTLGFAPHTLVILAPGRAFAYSDTRWALLRLNADSLTAELQGEMEQILALDKTNYLLRTAAGMQLFTITGESPLTSPLNLDAETFKAGSFYTFSQAKPGWFISGSLNSARVAYLVHRQSRRAVNVSFLNRERSVMGMDAEGRSVITVDYGAGQNQSAAIFELTEAGELAGRQDFPRVQVVSGGLVVLENGKSHTILLVGGSYQKLYPAAGEESVHGFDGEYLSAKKDGRYILRKPSETDPIYTSEGPAEILSPRGQPLGYVRVCGKAASDPVDYETGCRVENTQDPGAYSVLTGFHAYGGNQNARNERGTLRRGFASSLGIVPVWMEAK